MTFLCATAVDPKKVLLPDCELGLTTVTFNSKRADVKDRNEIYSSFPLPLSVLLSCSYVLFVRKTACVWFPLHGFSVPLFERLNIEKPFALIASANAGAVDPDD